MGFVKIFTKLNVHLFFSNTSYLIVKNTLFSIWSYFHFELTLQPQLDVVTTTLLVRKIEN
jgi:hypothetical protein